MSNVIEKKFGKMLAIRDSLTPGLKKFFKKIDPEAREKALAGTGMQIINWVVNGSQRSPIKPPIKSGRLRGSGTVFVGKKRIGDTMSAGKGGTPARSQSVDSSKDVIVVGFNTQYAANMHENLDPYGKKFQPHKDQGKAFGKFLERHLDADKKAAFELYAELYRKWAGT